jgi:hypothetical protein
MDIREATKSYERWLHRRGLIVDAELSDKHSQMKQDAFQFFRATYYRWAQLWPEICAESRRAPVLLAVGDLHIDSFGTWRDAEGRLCWGVDDFDEAWHLPYTNDLIRLATSVKIARKLGILKIKTGLACDVILGAYKRTLRGGGCPIVLAEEETHLEKLGIEFLKPPPSFWTKLNERRTFLGPLPKGARKALENTLPNDLHDYRVVRRESGLGSLGQLRFVAIAEYNGGCVAREAKNVRPSASVWANDRTSRGQSYYEAVITSALRSPDPYQKVVGSWLIRRLSPDSNPISIEEIPEERDEEALLQAMGTETANVHLGSRRRIKAVLKDLRARKKDWLRNDVRNMAKVFLREWKEYRRL